MKKIIAVFLAISMLFTVACGQLQQQHYEGAGAGALLGGIAGALLDKKNSWRGGVIGAALGAAVGATITDIANRAAKEAAEKQKTVVYETEDQTQKVIAMPVVEFRDGQPVQTNGCKMIKIQQYENGQKVSEKIECI